MIHMNVRRAFALWLVLMCWFSASGLSAQTKYISTQEELIEVLNSPTTRAGEEKPITPEGLAINREMEVTASGVRLCGGPLYRAEGYTGAMLKVVDGASVTVENTLDGKDVPASETIVIEEGGELKMAESGQIINVVKERASDVIVNNSGEFIMNGANT